MRPSLPALAFCLISPALTAQVRTESAHATVKIVDGVADTTVAITFRNDGAQPAEKILVLPLPDGATADKLELRIGGRLETGEILDRDRARGVYESIVRRRLDPALLEYVGRSTLRLRVFPVPPRGTQEAQVRFRMILPESEGLFSYEFPARAIGADSFAMVVTIESRKAIKNVYSPLSGMDTARKDDHHARCGYEAKGSIQRDPVVFYGLSDQDFGLNLLTYRKKGEPGYFLLMLAPKREWRTEKELEKSITFVLDTSGSMQGQKIEQAKNALRFFLSSLKPGDRFNVVPFSTEARPFAEGPVAASPDQVERARKLVESITAQGGTNLEEALRFALRAKQGEGHVPIVVFLTDGRATVGVKDTRQILASCKKANAAGARVFVFGVGNDVNTHLLDRLSRDTGGTREYVRPQEDLEIKTSALFTKLAHPVMTGLELDFGPVKPSRLAPGKLPDLFRGSRLVVAGRYEGTGATAIRLRGRLQDQVNQYVHDAAFPAEDTRHDFVATIWAQRRAGQLLDEIRLNGQNAELVAEVRRLGTEHGIVTPYTSGLVVEPGRPVARGGGRGITYRGPGGVVPPNPTGGSGGRAPGPKRGGPGGPTTPTPGGPTTPGPRTPAGPVTGGAASTGSDDFVMGRGLKYGAAAVRESTKAARLLYLKTLDEKNVRRTTRKVGRRTMHSVAGVWIDSAFTKEMQKSVRKVRAFSKEYFELVRAQPGLAKVLALGPAIVVVVEGKAIEVVPPLPEKKQKKKAEEKGGKQK